MERESVGPLISRRCLSELNDRPCSWETILFRNIGYVLLWMVHLDFISANGDDSKIPLVIVACGSYSPITYLHLRLFEMAADAVNESTNYEIVGGFFSPVSDSYRKPGLVAGRHRVRMCELACERTSNWLMVDAWEVLQPDYTPTAQVLDHFEEEINVKRQGVRTQSGEMRRCKIMLLAGGDLITSMGEPGVWADNDLQ